MRGTGYTRGTRGILDRLSEEPVKRAKLALNRETPQTRKSRTSEKGDNFRPQTPDLT